MSSFRLIKEHPLPEIHCLLREWIHNKSEAHVIHIECDDPENLFCLGFRTWPTSSNGVAHVLEHTVLCGSEKFPVKDPFFSMTRRSLNTFMNAFTGADFTCYPASTLNEKDFYNLLDVYLDAVFHPKLDRFSFLQEGIRLEHQDNKLVYKGIVYNEMKGALNSGLARLNEMMMAELYPDTVYGFNSGGDPKHIRELTYEELKSFHKKFYHPSQCYFFFYGNLPFDKHLKFIDEAILNKTDKAEPLPPVKRQPRFKEPKKKIGHYPIHAGEEAQTYLSIGWLTNTIDEPIETLALSVLTSILMETDASPLKKEILRSGLAKQALLSVDHEMADHSVMLTLLGANSFENVSEKVLHMLRDISKKGIDPEEIEQTIHQYELNRLEIGGDSHTPYGLSLYLRAGLLKMQGVEPEEALKVHSLFDHLRGKLKENPRYFSTLIDRYFINNTHRVELKMLPDEKMEQVEQREEEEHLAELLRNMSPEEILKIEKEASDLKKFQKKEASKSIDILPKVTLDDVPPKGLSFHLEQIEKPSLKIFQHDCFTNGILYADLVYDLPALKAEEIPYFRILTLLMNQLGSGGRTYEETLNFTQAHTGGLSISLSLNTQVINPNHFEPTLHIKGKSLNRKADKFLQLLKDFATTVDFTDKTRIEEVLTKHRVNLETTFNQSAMRYANSLSSSSINSPLQLSDLAYGLNYYYFIQNALPVIPFDELISRVKDLYKRIFDFHTPHLVLGGERDILTELSHKNYYGLEELPTQSRALADWNIPVNQLASQGRKIASPVAFISHSFKTVPYTHPDATYLALAGNLFDNLVLHTAIREEGGAYGGGSTANVIQGYFRFHSYRDPHINETLEAFKAAIQTIVSGDFSDDDLIEAKLELVQAMDGPVSPGGKAELAYNYLREGRTDQVRFTNRTRALAATKQDIQEAVQKHIQNGFDKGVTVVFAGEELLNKSHIHIFNPSGKR